MSIRVLVLGATGMLGHKLGQVLSAHHETHLAVRRAQAPVLRDLFDADRVSTGVSAEDPRSVERVLDEIAPAVVVNCIGIVKQADAARQAVPSITVNSLFPHRLGELCAARGARLIHISTDCVFSGRVGGYTEDDIPDPIDLYGRSKLLGEVAEPGCLTLRTSIVGRELEGAHGLLEWFLGQSGSVRGFAKAVFSGLTTEALSELVARVVREQPALSGLWHVAAEPIDKLALLERFRDAFGLDIEIVADDALRIDRSLDGSRFERETGIAARSWSDMVAGLAADTTPYERLRSQPTC